jgi:predicted MPP superfamily phosphohydrolase
VLTSITRIIPVIAGVDACAIWLRSAAAEGAETDRYTVAADYGFSRAEVGLPLPLPLADFSELRAAVAEGRQTVIQAADRLPAPLRRAGLSSLRQGLIIPLGVKGLNPMSQTTSVPPLKPDPAVLEKRWLHNVMLLLSALDRLPAWLNGSGVLLILGLNYLAWRWARPELALTTPGVLGGVMLLDILLLWQLPRRGISFGPVPSQVVVLWFPRLGVTLLALLLALWRPPAGLWAMVVLQLLGTGAYVWAALVEPHRLALTVLNLTSPHLPAGAPPVRLLHLSDLHLERLTRREKRLLDLIQAARPDLIVITGDFLNLSYRRNPEAIAQVRSLLAQIKAPYGVYATLGSPPVDVPDVAPQHFAGSHIQLLRGDVVEVDLGSGRRLTLMGMDCSHDMTYDEHLLSTLDKRRNGRQTTVLLYHSPELMPAARCYEVDLYLCGHTHGGQIRLPFYGAILTSAITGKRYEMGRYDENDTTLYVSRGIGLEGLSAPRMRLFCPPEITLVTLSNKATP